MAAPSSLVLPTPVLSEVPSLAWTTSPFNSAPQGPSGGPLGAGSPGRRRRTTLRCRGPRGGPLGAQSPARRRKMMLCCRGPRVGPLGARSPACTDRWTECLRGSRLVVVSLRGPGQSPVLPFACCVGSQHSVGRCDRCSCWCRFRVRGAQWLVCWGCARCGRMCRLPPPPPPAPSDR